MAQYGSVTDANAYFAELLHADEWQGLSTDLKNRALNAATQDIDRLEFAGSKLVADQALEFPREGTAEVPDEIKFACYEIAYARIADGRDPGREFEALKVQGDGAGSTRANFDRDNTPLEHLANGIVSFSAWRFLKPFLSPKTGFNINRV